MMTIVVLALAAAFVCGFGAGVVFNDAALVTMRAKHKTQMDEIYEEVKRLRAQNAMLIGKE